MDYEPFYRKKRKMLKDCLGVGMSFRDALERLKLSYTDFMFLFPNGLEYLTTLKTFPIDVGTNKPMLWNHSGQLFALETGIYIIWHYQWGERSYLVNEYGHYYFIDENEFLINGYETHIKLKSCVRDKKINDIINEII